MRFSRLFAILLIPASGCGHGEGNVAPVTVCAMRLYSFLEVPMQVGDQSQMYLHAYDCDGYPVTPSIVRWTSSAPAVISVGVEGMMTANSPGISTIVAAVGEVTAGANMTVSE